MRRGPFEKDDLHDIPGEMRLWAARLHLRYRELRGAVGSNIMSRAGYSKRGLTRGAALNRKVLAKNARMWFESEDESVGSFAWICDHVFPNTGRDGVRRLAGVS